MASADHRLTPRLRTGIRNGPRAYHSTTRRTSLCRRRGGALLVAKRKTITSRGRIGRLSRYWHHCGSRRKAHLRRRRRRLRSHRRPTGRILRFGLGSRRALARWQAYTASVNAPGDRMGRGLRRCFDRDLRNFMRLLRPLCRRARRHRRRVSKHCKRWLRLLWLLLRRWRWAFTLA